MVTPAPRWPSWEYRGLLEPPAEPPGHPLARALTHWRHRAPKQRPERMTAAERRALREASQRRVGRWAAVARGVTNAFAWGALALLRIIEVTLRGALQIVVPSVGVGKAARPSRQ